MKFVLILMIRNEEKILRRCLESVKGVVDAFCIHDTGSTDKTCEIAEEFLKENPGCLTKSVWKDFGHNRSLSFKEAQEWLRTQSWDLKDTYGLLLDADMEFVPDKLKEQTLEHIGYTILQIAGNLEYPNCRLVRMDYPWVCRGVTHEYWDGACLPLGKDICHIDDHNDGGCKSDKFERDLTLLLKGLEEDPTNVRYMFYVAQTYHSLGNNEKAIEWYTKRADAGGWFEEVWYSMYMISKSYTAMDKLIDAEFWVQKAYEYRPSRAEALYHFARALRQKGNNAKASYYINLGKTLPISTDSLFVEQNVYTGLFQYEDTIVRFYIQSSLRDGLRVSMECLLKDKDQGFNSNIYTNLPFYIEPVKAQVLVYPMVRDFLGFDFHPSSISVCEDIHNVRFVNYLINHADGSYIMKEGKYDTKHHVRTQNVVVINDIPKQMDDASVSLARRDTHIKGLEDVRIYRNSVGKLSFVATSLEYNEKIRIVRGLYHEETATYSDCVVMNSPQNQDCEKNWIPINGTDNIIYRWSPLEIGVFSENNLTIHTTYKTPWIFNHFRGSAVPVKVNDELWALVHFVEYGAPRKYFHCFVALDPKSYKPKRVSNPFVFRQKTIEYCLGVVIRGNIARCFVSTMDDSPVVVAFEISQLSWFGVV